MTERQPIHLLMRFSDRLGGINTIDAHKAIIKEKDAVWVGKMGKPLGRPRMDRINKQCAEGTPTFLYLVQRIGGAYEVHRGKILEVSRRPPSEEYDLVPPYYTNHYIFEYMTFWIKLSTIKPLDAMALNNLLISNTLMAVPYTLPRSMAALFIVRDGQGMRG